MGDSAFGMSRKYLIPFKESLFRHVDRRVEYVWGGKDAEELIWDTQRKAWRKGVDCSGLMAKAARDAKAPRVRRTTARRMALGLDGWTGRNLDASKLNEVDEGDIAFWTFPGKDPFGHTGAFVVGRKSGLLQVVHASYSANSVVIRPLVGPLAEHLVRVRKLDWK